MKGSAKMAFGLSYQPTLRPTAAGGSGAARRQNSHSHSRQPYKRLVVWSLAGDGETLPKLVDGQVHPR